MVPIPNKALSKPERRLAETSTAIHPPITAETAIAQLTQIKPYALDAWVGRNPFCD